MTVTLIIAHENDTSAEIEHARLECAVASVLAAAGYVADRTEADYGEVEVNLCLVDRDESAHLNNAYRGKNYATNVLAFPADAQVPGLWVLGDLVVCLPLVGDEASAQHKQSEDHLLHLVVHGTLHLLGYDHIGDEDADIMETMERRVLAGFNIADPYALSMDVGSENSDRQAL